MCGKEISLIETKKKESFSALYGMALHYLNNLMSGLYGMAQLAQMTRKDEHLLEAVDMTVKNIRKAKNLTLMMAQYSEAFGSNSTEADLGALVSSVLVLMEHDFEKYGISVNAEIPENNGGPKVKASSGDIIEMVFRIVNHSLKSMSSSGGTLSVGVKNDGSNIVFSVSDTQSRVPDDIPLFSDQSTDGHTTADLEDYMVAREMAAANSGEFRIFPGTDAGAEVSVTFHS